MAFLGILATVCWVAAFAGFVWLVVVAFNRSALWGVLVLLLSPITAIVYAVKFWDESKKPFMVYMGSSLAATALFMATIAAIGGAVMKEAALQMDQLEQQAAQDPGNSGAPDAPAPASMDPIQQALSRLEQEPTLSDGEPSPSALSVLDIHGAEGGEDSWALLDDDDTEPAPKKPRPRNGVVQLGEAKLYIGEHFEIVTKGGREYQGRLVHAEGGELRLSRGMMAGSFTIDLKQSDVKSLRIVNK